MPRHGRLSCLQKKNEVYLFLLIEKIRPVTRQRFTSNYVPPDFIDRKHSNHITVIGKSSLSKTE